MRSVLAVGVVLVSVSCAVAEDTVILRPDARGVHELHHRARMFQGVKAWVVPELDAVVLRGEPDALMGAQEMVRVTSGPSYPVEVRLQVMEGRLPADVPWLCRGPAVQIPYLEAVAPAVADRVFRSLPPHLRGRPLETLLEGGELPAPRLDQALTLLPYEPKDLWLRAGPLPPACDPEAVAAGFRLRFAPVSGTRGEERESFWGAELAVTLLQALPDEDTGVRIEDVFECAHAVANGESVLVSLRPGKEPPEDGNEVMALLTVKILADQWRAPWHRGSEARLTDPER